MELPQPGQPVQHRPSQMSLRSHHFAVVVPLPSLRSCFVRLSGPPSAGLLWVEQQRHFCRVLLLQQLYSSALESEALGLAQGASAQNLAAAAEAAGAPYVYVGWIGAGLTSTDATSVQEALAAAGAQLADAVCIGIAAPLCELIGLKKGEKVVVAAVDVGALENLRVTQQQQQMWPYTPSLEVAPLGTADWDAVQLHAEALEKQVLEQVALLMPNQIFPLWIKDGSKPVLLRVCAQEDGDKKDEAIVPFFLLNQDTELHVRPLAMASFRRLQSMGPTASDSTDAALRAGAFQRDILRVLPLCEELDREGYKATERDVYEDTGREEYKETKAHASERCHYCWRGGGPVADGSLWQYVCFLNPASLANLQERQQWLRPSLRCWKPQAGVTSSRAQSETIKQLVDQRAGAAEDVALVFVRRARVDRDASRNWQGDPSHAVMLAAASAEVPLGCVRLPRFVRRLYGWPLSSRVAVEPCSQVPTLPTCVLLTPIIDSASHEPASRADGTLNGCEEPSVAARVAAFLQSEMGSRRLLDAFLGLAGEGQDVAKPGPSGAHNSARDNICASRGLDFRAIWDGAVLCVLVTIKSEELNNLVQQSMASTSQQAQTAAAVGTDDNWGRTTTLEFHKMSGESEAACKMEENENPSLEESLGVELQELEDGLGDLYVSDGECRKDMGQRSGDQEVAGKACGEESLVRPDSLSGSGPGGNSEPGIDRGSKTKETLGEWAKLALTCSVVEEFSLGSEQEAAPQNSESSEICASTLHRQIGCGEPEEWNIPVNIIVSFNRAAAPNESEPLPLGSPRVQRNMTPRFSRALPPVFACLHHKQPPTGPETERIQRTCVVLDFSFCTVVRQGGVDVGVTPPLRFSVNSRGSTHRGEPSSLSLPLRFEGGPGASITSVDSQHKPRAPTSAGEAAGLRPQLLCPEFEFDSAAIGKAERLWWLLPYSTITRQTPAAAAVENVRPGAGPQLLQLLQQGCVEVPFAELASGMCQCGTSHFPSPLETLLQMGCSQMPLLEDFMRLRAFGEHPAVITRAVYRRLGAIHCCATGASTGELNHGPVNAPSADSSNSRVLLSAERRAQQAFRAVDVNTLLVCGPRGSGRSALCRALCIDVRRRLGAFTIIVNCRLLARESIPLALVRQALAGAFEAAEANSPSILVLDDLDTLCSSGENGVDRPSVAEARGSCIAAFLSDIVRRKPGVQMAAPSCAMEGPWATHAGRLAAPLVVTLATAVDSYSLHPSLADPLVFGGFKLHAQCDTSLISTRMELLRALLKLTVARQCKQDSTVLEHGALPANPLPVRLDESLLTDGGLWTIASKLDGYSLADLQAVVVRAVGESLLGMPIGASTQSSAREYSGERLSRPDAIVYPSHFHKALQDVLPRATQQQSFIHALPLPQPKCDLHDLLTLQRVYPFLLSASGISVHQGLLLIGPPGCGKTHLALAAVGEAGIRCIHVKGPELLGKFIGSSEAAVRDVFRRAQTAKPCAILFDEIEALATKRGGDTTGVTDRVVNQLLCYLDGIEAREDVFVVATTSRPDLVDAALLRPGRLEKVCFCGLPVSDDERTDILAVSLRSVATDSSLDIKTLGRLVPCTFTPADIQAAVNQAQLYAVQDALAGNTASENAGDPEIVVVTEQHIRTALQSCRPSLSVQEVQRYHRYSLPYLNQDYQDQVHAVERAIIAAAEHDIETGVECDVGPQSRCDRISAVDPFCRSLTQRVQNQHRLECVFADSDSNSVSGTTSQGFESNSKSDSPSLTTPESQQDGGEATEAEQQAKHGKKPTMKDHEMGGFSEIRGNKSETQCAPTGMQQKKRRRRKRNPSQLAGSRVALA